MFIQEATKAQALSSSVPSVELGNTSVHDAYMLEFSVTVTNDTGSSVSNLSIAEVLKAFNQITIQADNSKNLYALNALDIARRNAMYSQKGINTRVIDIADSTLADDASKTFNFVLTLDEGDVVALQHNNITLKADVASTVRTSMPITSWSIKPSIMELIPQTEADISNTYGANFEYALEPKVYIREDKLAATSEYTGFAEIPTGGLLKSAMITWDTSGDNATPAQWGLVQIVPTRTEISRLNWLTSVTKDQRRFGTELAANTTSFDFSTDWMLNGMGKDGRTFNRGDYYFAALPAAGKTVSTRTVYFEQMFPAGAGEILTAGKRFV